MPANVLVGCGGSGLKTLLKINELLCQDTYWRTYMQPYVYYVGIDTDEKDLADFRAAIKEMSGVKTMGGRITTPFCRTIHLARGLTHLQPTVMRYFDTPFRGGKNPSGKERLQQHWWTDDDGKPFVAASVKPLSKGAGQCPPVSHFLAWLHISEIRAAFKKVVDQIHDRVIPLQGGQNPLASTNCILVGSLAGGTGRGCWPLVGYSLRQAFLDRGGENVAMPMAFLYDAECFPEVFNQHPDQIFGMKVNALTGASELASWIGLSTSDFEYRLPSMQRPENKKSDVLNPKLRLGEYERSPVDTAALICNSHELGGGFESSSQAIGMVGTSLYGLMSQKSIQSQAINSHQVRFSSVGSISFRVPAYELRKHYESEAPRSILAALQETAGSLAEERAKACLSNHGLTFGHHGFYESDLTKAPKNAATNLLNLACQNLLKDREKSLAALETCLKEQKVKNAQAQAKTVVAANEKIANAAFNNALKTFCDGDHDSLVSSILHDADEFLLSSKSYVATERFCDIVSKSISDSFGRLPDPKSVARMENSTPEAYLADQITLMSNREWKSGRLRTLFTNDETLALVAIASDMVLRVNYGAIHTKLKTCIAAVTEALAARKKACAAMVKAAKAVAAGLPTSAEAPFVNVKEPLRDLHHTMRRVERVLAPVPLSSQAFHGAINTTDEWSAFLVDSTSSDLTSTLTAAGLRDKLQDTLNRSIYLDESFIETHFSMAQVLTDLQPVWAEYFKSIRNNDVLRRQADQEFYVHFGFRPEFKKGMDAPEFPTTDAMMLAMAKMVTRQAKAYWRLRDDATVEDALTIYIPTRTKKDDLSVHLNASDEEEKNLLERSLNTGASAAPDSLDVPSYNPYILLVCAHGKLLSNNLSDVINLNYSEPRILEWLQACERATGGVLPPVGSDQRVRHTGFVTPMFLTEPAMVDNRWRPWVDAEELKRERETRVSHDQALDALAYAMMSKTAAVVTATRNKGWSLPLIVPTDKGKGWQFARRSYGSLDGTKGKGKVDPTCPWKKDQVVATSDKWLLSVFAGSGDSHGRFVSESSAFVRAIAQEAALFWADVLPGKLKSEQLDHAAEEFRARQDAAKSPEDKALWERLVERVVANQS